MEYNTSRKKMTLPEYGRNIQRMVDYVVSIEDKEKRNRLAHALIGIMGNMNPHLRDISDFKHKLWDHLAIISDFKLDIDSPYPPPSKEVLEQKPDAVPYSNAEIKYKHYGKTLELLVEEAIAMPEGEERDALIMLTANHMKKSYLQWNKDAVTDDVIFNDLKNLSGGKIDLTGSDIQLSEAKDFQPNKPNKPSKPRNKRPYRKHK
ncbi:MAG: DUF4290 domain-containing protein [Bacteroidales bacterium]|jgi:hypothetical protein